MTKDFLKHVITKRTKQVNALRQKCNGSQMIKQYEHLISEYEKDILLAQISLLNFPKNATIN